MTISSDQQAFSDLYKTYFNRIYAYIFRRVNNKQDCEDLVSQVFTKAFSKRRTQPEPDKIISWLFRIAHNETVDYYRKKGRKNTFLSRLFKEHNSVDSRSPEQVVLTDEKNNEIIQLLGVLPDDKQEILMLRFFGQLTNKEIGEVIGKKETAVKMAVYRSIQKLRQEVEKGEKKHV